MSADPYFQFVKLLLGGEGADASTVFTDESPVARGNATVGGNAQVDTAQFKFGAASLLLDGTGDYLSFADSADWHLGTGHFTIEFFVRFNALPATNQVFIGQWGSGAGTLSTTFYKSTAGKLEWAVSTTGSNVFVDISATWSPVINTQYHVAIDYDGTKYRAYIDGVMIGSSTTARNIFNAPTVLGIGVQVVATASFPVNGWMDEIRWTKGVARYASDGGFTVPAEAYPRTGTQELAAVFDDNSEFTALLALNPPALDLAATFNDDDGFSAGISFISTTLLDLSANFSDDEDDGLFATLDLEPPAIPPPLQTVVAAFST